MHLHHEGSMIEVQGLLMICTGNIRASKDALQTSMVDSSIVKLMPKSNFSLLSSFWLQFERVINGLGGQKSYQMSI